jgi:hypothetical protein
MPSYAIFDRSGFPIITIVFTGAKATPENFALYLEELEHNYARQEPIAIIFDARKALPLNPLYQQKQAQWMKQHEPLVKQFCRGIAFVIPNPILRTTLKLIFRIQNNPVPFKVFSTIEEGEEWSKGLTIAH